VRFTLQRLMIVVAGFALLLWCYDSSSVAVCDGSYTLDVRVKSVSDVPIQSVTCEAFANEEAAAPSLTDMHRPETSWSATSYPFTGRPLSVSLPFTVRVSPFGRLVGDFQYRALLVIVTYRDGRRAAKVTFIPHRDASRSVTVDFP